MLQKTKKGSSKVAQEEKFRHAAKPAGLSSFPGTHVVEGES